MVKNIFTNFILFALIHCTLASENICLDNLSKKSAFEYINTEIVKENENSTSLFIDTTKADASGIVFKTDKNLFKPNKTYTATIKYNISNQNQAKLVKMQLRAIADNQKVAVYNLFTSKPTSIAKLKFVVPQNAKLKIEGRHDSCIVPRAVPVIEAIAALAIYDSL